jgi:hypothetical protein
MNAIRNDSKLSSNQFIGGIHKALYRLPQSGVENSSTSLLPVVAARHTIIFAIVTPGRTIILAVILTTIHVIHLFYSRYIIFY